MHETHRSRFNPVPFILVLAVAFGCGVVLSATADEIGFVEDFSLAADRAAALKQLVPGTEEFYYYHCLHLQNTQQFDQVDKLVEDWIKRHNYTASVREILNRQALLTYAKNPAKSLEYVRQQLNLQFNHQREVLGAKPNLPTALDPKLIGREALAARALSQHPNLEGFEDAALDWLTATELNPDRRRHLLQRLTRPDYANLAKLVVDDLNYKDSGGFGSLPTHGKLLLSQLDELLKFKPELLNQTHFVNAYLMRLHPTADADGRDPTELAAYLDRLWKFVARLAPAHNSLKAHVLFHRLALDRSRGTYDKERFFAYLRLPRNASYVNPKYLEQDANRGFVCDLNATFDPVTLLPAIGDDEPLVRGYLQNFFVQETTFAPYEPFVHDVYLKHLFAETKIVNGLGESEQWASLLPPAQFQALKERIDLDFSPANPRRFAVDEPVAIDVFVKNVPTLIVKVFELNTRNFYRQNLREVETDINLDGLVANEEKTYTYNDPPLRRIKRRFEFPSLAKPGVYVVDFIGNGRSSRVLIRKGRLHHLVRTSSAGHVFTVLNEKNDHVRDASLWVAGHEYTADKDGVIAVPFSTQPGQQPVVLSRGEISSLDHFKHEAEDYSLRAGFYVDRESLLAGKKALVIVRPVLHVHGTPIAMSLLKEVRLVITSTDLDGVASSKEVADFKLFDDRESTYEFQVPPRLAQISFRLKANVQNISQNQKQDLDSDAEFAINEIDKSDKIEDLHFGCFGGKYVVELLGKTGEPKADRAVQFVLKHRDFREHLQVTLQTDNRGHVVLGELRDISFIAATGPEGMSQAWSLPEDQHSYYQSLHGVAWQPLEVPYVGSSDKPSRGELSLLELRGDAFVADHFDALSIVGGMIRIQNLPAGDYDLWLKATDTHIRLRFTTGPRRDGYVLGDRRHLEVRGDKPLHIKRVETGKDEIKIRLQNPTTLSRVHVFATRYGPEFSAFKWLSRTADLEPNLLTLGSMQSAYVGGRDIGDEYRYVLARRLTRTFPGNSLDRPGLLLNPWAVRSTETGEQELAGETKFDDGGVGTGEPFTSRLSIKVSQSQEVLPRFHDSANLDFLAEASVVLVNLLPDKDGVVTIGRAALGDRQQIHVVAIDPRSTTYRTVSLPEAKTEFIDLRLSAGLDPKRHFTQQKQVTIVGQGETFTVADITSSRFEIYDSLARVYSLYATLSRDPKLAEFSFILNWHKLKPEEKRTLYSKHACHELNFFLFKKDPDFFRQAVQPYLLNKKDKTFLDRWLVRDDLTSYRQPWQHERLNVVERILLGQTLPAERDFATRHVKDVFDLLPPNLDRSNQLFKTALLGNALDATDALMMMVTPRIVVQEELEKEMWKARFNLRLNAHGASDPGAKEDGFDRTMKSVDEADMPLDDRAAIKLANPETWAALSRKRKALQSAEKKSAAEQLRRRSGYGFDVNGSVDADGEANGDGLPKPAGFDAGYMLFGDEECRAGLRQLYRKLDKTQEWAENNYNQLAIEQQMAGLVSVNSFWRDYAAHDPARPFLSKHFAAASNNFTEMMFALALLDLPAEAGAHETKVDKAKLTLTAASPLIVFHEQIQETPAKAGASPILISQNFFRHGDRQRTVNNEQVDKFITDEFLIHVVYGCQVVVTNPTSSRQKLDLLLQIPMGSLPLAGGQATRTVAVDLQPYSTHAAEYLFYFPAAGKFPHYPLHVAKNGELLAHAAPVVLNVVREPTQIDRESWDWLSQNGSDDDVLNHLKQANLHRLSLDKIAFRMSDAKFFDTITKLLAARHVYSHTLWSYAIKHNAPAAAREFLAHADDFVQQCGLSLRSPLLTIDPVARHSYQHLEYKPLVNPRAHALGQRRQILNKRFFGQYHELLKVLSYQPQLSDDDLLAVTYYLLLQDRTEEAQSFFGRVNANVATRLQHDYFTAYFDLFTDDHKLAGPIAAKYAEHPVDRWRNAFAAVTAQLDEIYGAKAKVVDVEDRNQQQATLAATEPSFDFQVEAKQIVLNYQQVEEVVVNYYLMDLELLFSRNPFVQQQGQFSFIRPNQSQQVKLPAKQKSHKFELPKSLHTSNVLVEITAAGQTKSQPYYSHALNAQLTENYGQLKLTHVTSGQPIAKAYVKVYARLTDGTVRFFKDGYTDLRGRFDYSSLNTNELDNVQKFALLILSEDHGAVVREANPPKQ